MSWALKCLLFVTLSPSKDISKYNQPLAGIPTLPSLTFWTLDRAFEKKCCQCAGHHLSGNQEPYTEITNIHFKFEETWNFNYSSVRILYWQLFFLYMSQAWGLICTKTLQQSACCAVSLLTSSTWLFSIKLFTVFSVWETICCHKIHWRVNIKPVIKSALYKWIHHSCCHGPKMWFSLKQRAFWVASPCISLRFYIGIGKVVFMGHIMNSYEKSSFGFISSFWFYYMFHLSLCLRSISQSPAGQTGNATESLSHASIYK